MTELKVTRVGKGLGLELPQEIVEQLHLGAGDNISLEQMAHGSFRLRNQTDMEAEQIALIEGYMHEEDA